MSGERQPGGQVERGTTLTCRECREAFTPKNRNGVTAGFCSRRCLDRNRNRARLQAAAALKDKSPRRSKTPAPGKRQVLIGLIPPAERPALLLAAAIRLGLTEESAAVRMARETGAKEIALA